jgi:DNA transposition AAA+ family ATPase
MSSASTTEFVETLQHRRFVEFCDSCRRYGYIGLCYGPPGVGKTLSARRYSHWDQVKARDCWQADTVVEGPVWNTVFYTPPVVNTPGVIDAEINRSRERLRQFARQPVRFEAAKELKSIRQRDKDQQAAAFYTHDWLTEPIPELQPTYTQVAKEFAVKELKIGDPTTLILVDEADRLRMASLEQVRAIFDAGDIGLVLIGMPGLEKRLARYPQFYSRVGFVHEFRPLGTSEMQQLLSRHWAPQGVTLPRKPLDTETTAAIIRVTGGNFRLLSRLLAQIERLLEINLLDEVSKAVVEAARESLVVGES